MSSYHSRFVYDRSVNGAVVESREFTAANKAEAIRFAREKTGQISPRHASSSIVRLYGKRRGDAWFAKEAVIAAFVKHPVSGRVTRV